MPELPLVGAQVALLGVAAFNANVRTVNSQLTQLSRGFAGVGAGVVAGFSGVSDSSVKLANASNLAVDAFTRLSVAQTATSAAYAAATKAQTIATGATTRAANAAKTAAEVEKAAAEYRFGTTSIDAAAARAAATRAESLAVSRVNASKKAADAAKLASRQEVEAYNESIRALRNLESAEAAVAAESAAASAALRITLITTAAVVAAALVGAAGAAVALGQKYGQQVAYVGAISEATASRIGVLDDAQLDLSRHSTQGAIDLSNASQELVKAGFSIGQITGATLKAVNDLVIASDGELKAAEAATLAQVSTAAFGATVTEAANAATAATVRSALTYSGYSTAIRQAGNAAANAGLTVQEFAAVVGVAGKTISSGTVVGTGLRQMFVRLQNPTSEASGIIDKYGLSLYYANGAARPLRDVIAALSDAFSDNAVASGRITQAERDRAIATLFTTRALNVGIAVANQGVKAYDDLLASQSRLTTADIAGKVLKPTNAQAQILSNNIKALGISFDKGLDPYIRSATGDLVKFFQTIDLDLLEKFGAAVGLAGAVLARFTLPFARRTSSDELKKSFAALEGRDVKDFLKALADQDAKLKSGGQNLDEYKAHVAAISKAYSDAVGGIQHYGTALDANERHPLVAPRKGIGLLDEETAQEEADRAKKVEDVTKKAFELTRDYNDDVEKLTRQTADRVSKLYEDTFDTLAQEAKKASDDIRKATDEAAKQVNEAQIARAIRDDQEARRKDLDTRLKDEDAARKQTLDAEKDAAKQEADDVETAQKRERDAREGTYKQALDLAEETRKAVREQEDLTFKQSQDALKQHLRDQQDAEEASLKRRQDDEELGLKRQTDALERALKDQQAARERDLKTQQDVRERTLRDQQDANDRALKADQDARERALKSQIDQEKAAFSVQQDLESLLKKDTQERAQAQYEYQQDIARGVKESIAQARLQEKLGKIGQNTADARRSIQDKQQQDQQQFGLEQRQQQRLRDLQEQFDRETLAQKTKAEQQTIDLREQTERETLALREQTERETLDLQDRSNTAQLALKRRQEDQVTQFHREQESARDAFDANLDRAALVRSQALAGVDAQFKRDQEAQFQGFRQQLEDEATQFRRQVEETERARSLQLDLEETAFHRDQEAQRAVLEAKFEEEDLARRIQNIYQERDERIRAAQEGLAEQQAVTRKKLAQDVLDLRASLDEQIKEIRTRYLDRLQDLVDQTSGALQPLVDKILSGMDLGLDRVRQSAADAVMQLIETFKAEAAVQDLIRKRAALPQFPGGSAPGAGSPGGPPGSAGPGQDQPISHQYGGVVPGPYGSRQWILAHGGEQFLGIGGESVALMAVRLAESMSQRGIGGSSYVTNHYEYSVEANYGRVQPEGSIRQDLSALEMLTRR